MRASTIVWAVAAVAAVVWLGLEVDRAAPIDRFRGSSGIPVVHSEAQAEAAVRGALFRYGGLPRDAELTQRSGEMAMMTGPVAELPSNPARQMSYFFRWTPRGVIAGRDVIWAMVDDAERRTCLDASCRSYKLDYHLEVTSLQRNWHPAWLRSLMAWWTRVRAKPAPVPLSVSVHCTSGHFDIDAFRRVVGSVDLWAPYQGMWNRRNPRPILSGSSVFARFMPYRLSLDPKHPQHFYIRAAIVSDEPEYATERSVSLLMWRYDEPKALVKRKSLRNLNPDAPYWWQHFESADNEPICGGVSTIPRATVLAKSVGIAPIIDARFRVWNEIEQQNAFHVKFDLHPRVSTIPENNGKSVTIDWRTDRGVWHGTYHYDRSGMLEAVRINRP